MAISHTDPAPNLMDRPRLRLPFIDTGPLFDLRWSLLLFPVWWVLGIEQFIWPVILLIATAKLLYLQHFKVIAVPPLKWFALYLLAILISSFFIVESFRWFTYIRNFGAYLAGFLIFLIITNRARSWKAIDKLVDALLIAMLIAGVAGVLAAIDVWRPEFQSIVGRLLPSAVADTNYGRLIVSRRLGGQGWFAGLGAYYRLSSLFLYGTHYASAIVFTLPFMFMRLDQKNIFKKIAVVLGIALLVVNLVFTTGRVAMVSLLGGGLYFVIFHSLHRRTVRALLAICVTLLLLLTLLFVLLESSYPSPDNVTTRVTDSLSGFLLARGSGSFTDRFAVYQSSLEGVASRPFFGWGTERDVPGVRYPAGSHSEYVAVLYRQGLVGFILFIGLLWSSWRSTRPPSGTQSRLPEGTLLRYGRWFFVTALLNSLAADPAIDTPVYVIVWCCLGLLVAASRLVRSQTQHVTVQH